MNIEDQLTYHPDTGLFKWLAPVYPRKEGWFKGSSNPSGYRYIKIGQKNYATHRLAVYLMTGEMPSGVVDHINGVRDDNRLSNLRVCNQTVNLLNKKKVRGTRQLPSGNFMARVRIKGREIYIGSANTEEEAHQMYLTNKAKLVEDELEKLL